MIAETMALCGNCRKPVPAKYCDRGGFTWLVKFCPEHGDTEALIDRTDFFSKFYRPNNPIYPGHFIQITDRCNLSCSYCYYPCKEGTDKPLQEILAEADVIPGYIMLTGGEPTLRRDLPLILQLLKGRGTFPTNGTGLLYEPYFDAIAEHVNRADENSLGIALSYHSEYPELFHNVMQVVKNKGEKLSAIIFTLTNLNQLDKVKEIANLYREQFICVRIHLAVNIWNAGDNLPMFAADLVDRFEELGGTTFPDQGKHIWIWGELDGIPYRMTKWDSLDTIDLLNCDCGPTIMDDNLNLRHFTHGLAVNG